MKSPFKDIEETAMEMLQKFPASSIPDDLRALAIELVEDGHPAEYYAGMMHGVFLASKTAAIQKGKKGDKLAVKLISLSVGIAIRYHESCPMEVR